MKPELRLGGSSSVPPDRSTKRWGWRIWGGGLCAIAGIVFLGQLWVVVVLPWWIGQHFDCTTCTVLDKRMDCDLFPDADGYRPGPGQWAYRPEFLIRYSVAGRQYQTWTYDAPPSAHTRTFEGKASAQAVLDSFSIQEHYPCWYNRDDPAQAVLVRRAHSPWWLLFPVPFVLIGIWGLHQAK